MKKEIFKAYDIRGTVNKDLFIDDAYIIGQSYGSYLKEKVKLNKCVIGMDNRLTSPLIKENLIKGLLSTGINVIDYGLITTPMHYYTRYINKTCGIMVTASHNPKDDNGFKFSFDELANARGTMIDDFRNYTFNNKFIKGKGIYVKRDIKDEYLNYLKDNINMGSKKIKAVFDPGNGTTSTIIHEVNEMFPNIIPVYINDLSDGTFPNHHPDPAVEENMEMLKKAVIENKADIGIAYDGDGDRLGIIDEQGNFIKADIYLIIAIRDIINKVNNKTFLCDVKCSKTLIDEIEKLGGSTFMSRTGTSFTESNTKANNIPLGGELSGHIFFNDRGPEVCSAIYAGLRFIEILSKTDKSFSELLENINKYYSTPEIKVPVDEQKKFIIVEKVKQYVIDKGYKFLDIDGVRVTYDDSWVLVRASNTGPNLTLRFEATTEEKLNILKDEYLNKIKELISQD